MELSTATSSDDTVPDLTPFVPQQGTLPLMTLQAGQSRINLIPTKKEQVPTTCSFLMTRLNGQIFESSRCPYQRKRGRRQILYADSPSVPLDQRNAADRERPSCRDRQWAWYLIDKISES